MLDMDKRYYVRAGTLLRSTIEGWANENTMKLIGEDVALPECWRVYELDVQYNEKLSIKMALLGSGASAFMNGKRKIGRVGSQDSQRVVIYPELRDR